MSGANPGADEQYCSSCGEVIKMKAEICPECGVRQQESETTSGGSTKNKNTAGILALLLGGLGAHHFYLGNTVRGLLYIVFVWTFIPAIAGLIEGIMYLTKSEQEFQQKYVN
jgi:TM2 domain-containing membrane protein YozV